MKLASYQANHDRGASRTKEYAWIFVKTFFFMPFLPLPSPLRVWLLRSFGARVGKRVVIRSRVNIAFPWRLSIGNAVWIGEGVEILNLSHVTIGNDCCLSQQAFLCTGGHDFTVDEFSLITKPIVIENECWITARCFIGPGVTVGHNSLCAVGSVVIKSVEPNSVVGGVPARPIKR